jgi:hypothetical protein
MPRILAVLPTFRRNLPPFTCRDEDGGFTFPSKVVTPYKIKRRHIPKDYNPYYFTSLRISNDTFSYITLSIHISLRLKSIKLSKTFFSIPTFIWNMRIQVLTAAILPPSSRPWWWRQCAPLKHRYTSTRVHDATLQKILNFKYLKLSEFALHCVDLSQAVVSFVKVPRSSSMRVTAFWLYDEVLLFTAV